MENEHTAAASPDPAIQDLGLPESVLSDPAEMTPGAKRSAWALGAAGLVAFSTLAIGAIAVLDWAIPYLRYLYLVMLGAGDTGF